VITHALGDNIVGVVAAYSGCVTTGDPVDVSSINNLDGTGGTAVTALSITPSVTDCMILFYTYCDNDRRITGHSGSNPTFTERFDHISTLGGDGGVHGADGIRTTADATGNRTATLTDTAGWGASLIALKPVVVGGTIPLIMHHRKMMGVS